MRISLIAIGNELLDGFVTDSNSTWIENELLTQGLRLQRKTIVRDEEGEIRSALDNFKNKSDLIIVTGGLGPTGDDRTREAVAEFLGKKLEIDQGELEKIREKFAAIRVRMPGENEKQAMVIPGSKVLDNPKGTAPGFIVMRSTLTIAAFPGVPSELQAMFHELIIYINGHMHINREPVSVYMRTIGEAESLLDEALAPLKEKGISVGTVAHFGQVDIRLDYRNKTPEEVKQELDRALENHADIRERIFSYDRNESIAAAVIRKLTEKGEKLFLAESCTGGLIAKTLTDVPGSSSALLGSVVAYDNLVKKAVLGVDEKTLSEHGAVSAETALGMIRGLKKIDPSGYRISVTGIAGPDGGSEAKPVGTVFIGFGKGGEEVALRFQFGGNRENVRTRTMMKVFEILWLDMTKGSVNFKELRGLKDLINP